MRTGEAGLFQVIRSDTRGHFDHGWLDTHHSFSFGDYHDPGRMGFRALRVMNEDRVAPGMGFGRHPHRDMEIITYVLEGTLRHADSLGHGGPIRAGELQRITAGTGIFHSEQNDSETDPVHLYQIWLIPERPGLEPGYEQRAFDPAGRRNRWQVVASPDAREGSLRVHQDASLSLARLEEQSSLTLEVAEGRHGCLQVLRGRIALEGTVLKAGDGATLAPGGVFELEGLEDSEVLRFDLA